MCAADTRLEQLHSSAGGVVTGVEGRGTTHEHRNNVGVCDWITSQWASGIL